MFYFKKQKGFTLIELLVVLSIISLLSSIILATVSNTKTKARDAVVKQGVREFEKLLQLEYSDNGSFSNLQVGRWIPQDSIDCTDLVSFFSGAYVTQAKNICNTIVLNTGTNYSNLKFISGPTNEAGKYSIMAQLSNGLYFCAGFGGVSIYSPLSDSWGWTGKGCYYNP